MGADVLRSASALLESRFGNLDDLPDELADTVANYCYRWALLENDPGIRRRLVRHLPAGTDPEQRLRDHDAALASAIERFPSMLKALRDLRRTDGDAVFSRSCELFVDRFKYRIPDAEQKSRIRRAVERRLRRSEEIGGLYRVLLSVCAPERATPAEDLMTKLAVTIAAAAAILCAGAGLSDRAYALTAGWPAGVLAAAAAVDRSDGAITPAGRGGPMAGMPRSSRSGPPSNRFAGGGTGATAGAGLAASTTSIAARPGDGPTGRCDGLTACHACSPDDAREGGRISGNTPRISLRSCGLRY
jgi:hypothetical protein